MVLACRHAAAAAVLSWLLIGAFPATASPIADAAAKLATNKLAKNKKDADGLRLLKFSLLTHPDGDEGLLLLDALETDLPLRPQAVDETAFVKMLESAAASGTPDSPMTLMQYAVIRMIETANEPARIAQIKAKRAGLEVEFDDLFRTVTAGGATRSGEHPHEDLWTMFHLIFTDDLYGSVQLSPQQIRTFQRTCIEKAKAQTWETAVAKEAHAIAGRMLDHLDMRNKSGEDLAEARTYQSKFRTERSASLQRAKDEAERTRRMRNAESNWTRYCGQHKNKEKAYLTRLQEASAGTVAASPADVRNLFDSPVFATRTVTRTTTYVAVRTPQPDRKPHFLDAPSSEDRQAGSTAANKKPEEDDRFGAPDVAVAKPKGPLTYADPAKLPGTAAELAGTVRELQGMVDRQSRQAGGVLFTNLVAVYSEEGRAVLYAEAGARYTQLSRETRQSAVLALSRMWASRCQQYGKVWQSSHAHVFIYHKGREVAASNEANGNELRVK